ncbi:MAG: hypothetical protein HZB29_06240 [Nitrospinae bacterium]|nr:hypothetical protein [Nitrospinota bacterium]
MNLKKAPIHIHHIGSHFTSAMFPVASLLLTIYVINGDRFYEVSAFHCVIAGLLAAPVTYFSGAYDWKTRFSGRRTRIFDHKLIFGVIFMALALGIVSIRIAWPEIMVEGGVFRWVYLCALYSATAVAAYLGHLGSKFI